MAILRNTTFSGTGFLSMPAGTTAQRPTASANGSTVVDLTTAGTATWTVPAGVTQVEILLVAGGGGGGYQVGGGGGGGGVVYRPAYPVTPGASITYTIGSGGAGGTSSTQAYNGGNTTFGSGVDQLIAYGGGAGSNHSTGTGGYDGLGQNGGSGGGGAGDSSSRSRRGGFPIDGQGFPGGRGRAPDMPGFSGDAWAGGGGGGAGGPGFDSTVNAQGGRGGIGILSGISGTLTYYGGGGGGCNSVTGNPRVGGGAGGGGQGTGNSDDQSTKNGTNGLGGGGGGVRDTSGSGGSGGSGRIIIRYWTDRLPLMTGSVRYNSDTNKVEYFLPSGNWYNLSVPFLSRTVITTAYNMGGYQNSSAWNNVNRTMAHTDTTINLGDGALERSFNYQSGANSKNLAYVFGAGNGHAVSSNYVIAFNMRTETPFNPGSGMSRTMANSRFRFSTIFKEHYTAWISQGGSTAIEEYNMTTQTLIGTLGVTQRNSGDGWGMSHENFGFFFWANDQDKFDFATRTVTNNGNRGTHVANSDQQKSVQSKYSWCWAGNEGTYNGGNTLRRSNMYTDVTVTGTSTKPVGNSGEENFTIGQDWQYMLGMYNGAQNNASWKYYYYTETGAQNTATLEPKGKGGASSACCSWKD